MEKIEDKKIKVNYTHSNIKFDSLDNLVSFHKKTEEEFNNDNHLIHHWLFGNRIKELTELFGKYNFLFKTWINSKIWYINYEGFKIIIISHRERGTDYYYNTEELPENKNIDDYTASFIDEIVKLYKSIHTLI